MTESAPLAEQTRKTLRELVALVETLTTSFLSLSQNDKVLSDQAADLSRRQSESEQRAQALEQQASDLKARVERAEKIVGTSQALIEAINRLPSKMDDAHMIPGANRPAVPLYGTYEWRAVMDAKFLVEEAFKEKRVL